MSEDIVDRAEYTYSRTGRPIASSEAMNLLPELIAEIKRLRESKSTEVVHRNAEPLKIKLAKGQKDSYGWEISCSGDLLPEILSQIRAADAALKAEYGGRA